MDFYYLHFGFSGSSRMMDALKLVRKHKRICGLDQLLHRIVDMQHTSELSICDLLTGISISGFNHGAFYSRSWSILCSGFIVPNEWNLHRG